MWPFLRSDFLRKAMSMKLIPRRKKLSMKMSRAWSREGSWERSSRYIFLIVSIGSALLTVLSIRVRTCRKGWRSSMISSSTARL